MLANTSALCSKKSWWDWRSALPTISAPPLTASDLSKHLGLPRSNVRRCLDALINEGVLRKEGEHGYRGELDWLASRIDAEYFLKIRDAIITAADELKALDEP